MDRRRPNKFPPPFRPQLQQPRSGDWQALQADGILQMMPHQNPGNYPMPTTDNGRSPEEVARLGAEAFEQQVQPALRDEDEGKFVAIDVGSGDYELDEDDYTAVSQLRKRRPTAEVWLGRVGQPAAYRMRWQS
jgi:hypothetical protein